MKQSGGHIWVYSEPGRGTTFKIYLPCADYKVGAAGESEAEALPPRREGTRILVVEDDPIMRALTRKILEEHGYRVLEAEDGKAALDRIATAGDAIELTLTDVVMRGMSGPELALHLTKSFPEMKVVYMSGYTGELIGEHGRIGTGIPLLEKPFTRISLLKIVHAALE